MNKLILAALGTAIAAAPLAAVPAAAQQRVTQRTTIRHTGHGTVTRTTTWRDERPGDRFGRHHARDRRIVSNYGRYGLPVAPRGAHWARSGRDLLLVGRHGRVLEVRHAGHRGY